MSAYRHKHASKKFKTKRKTKDLDEIEADTEPENATKLLNQPVDYDVAGAAQFYCLHCARYFVDDRAMTEHFRGKAHKRRLKDLENGQYTQEEADAAGGMGSYRAPKRRKFETQPYVEKMDPVNTQQNE